MPELVPRQADFLVDGLAQVARVIVLAGIAPPGPRRAFMNTLAWAGKAVNSKGMLEFLEAGAWLNSPIWAKSAKITTHTSGEPQASPPPIPSNRTI